MGSCARVGSVPLPSQCCPWSCGRCGLSVQSPLGTFLGSHLLRTPRCLLLRASPFSLPPAAPSPSLDRVRSVSSSRPAPPQDGWTRGRGLRLTHSRRESSGLLGAQRKEKGEVALHLSAPRARPTVRERSVATGREQIIPELSGERFQAAGGSVASGQGEGQIVTPRRSGWPGVGRCYLGCLRCQARAGRWRFCGGKDC